MYGLLRLPSFATVTEKAKYGKYMCALCCALHNYFGLTARIFANYDCTTLALLIGALDRSFDRAVLLGARKKPAGCLSKSRAPHEHFRFISSVSVMLAYAKFLDRAIDKGKRMPSWIRKLSTAAFNHLSVYGLDESFIRQNLKQQHELEESGCDDIGALSAVSSGIVSRICGGIAVLTGNPQHLVSLEALGAEIGKMVYVLDGLSDYAKDIRRGRFNCIQACRLEDVRGREEVGGFLNNVRGNIASLLAEMQADTSLLRGIFLGSPMGRPKTELCGNNGLVEQRTYSLLCCVAACQSFVAEPGRYPKMICAPYFQPPDNAGYACCCALLCGVPLIVVLVSKTRETRRKRAGDTFKP